MPEYVISGIPVNFPFEPYKLQKEYMEKVIECLRDGTNGVLESPTGTGKTLSLLCSTLAWVLVQKTKVQANIREMRQFEVKKGQMTEADILKQLNANSAGFNVPKIIYASRTHSQLSQAMQEMKNTSYSFMRAVILGSRDQMCIHPDVSKEENNTVKTNLCKAKLAARACSFYSRVEKQKDHPEVTQVPIMDIEDLVRVGMKVKACPFFLSKELLETADIIFMPYNYLLDPRARRANGLEIGNSIIILDEAHNVEKMCEESASTQLKSSEIAVCINDITSIMKVMDSSMIVTDMMDDDGKKDFTIEDLALLKEMFLNLEQEIDKIPVNATNGSTFPGNYIYQMLEKVNITHSSHQQVRGLIENLILYISTITEKNNFVRRGGGLQTLLDALTIIFAGVGEDFLNAVNKCYKVHIELEEQKQTRGNVRRADGWTATKQSVPSVAGNAKIINFWCFNPGFGMRQVLTKQARSIILTSGTLAPLKPLISELDIPVSVRLENPHIIDHTQVCVKIVSQGPDKENLCSSFANRDNPKYIASLGRTILSFCPVIPAGLLIFFPSYTILNKCKDEWQSIGIWAQISRIKPIFVEPRTKEAFLQTMEEYYAKINEPESRGAIFMAVCRGKVSEGLDFADMNGRAVIITGLPFPPLMDPRVILKKKYLDENRTKENEIISGDEWYGLEAARAVNQAIGRVIRHRNDYGAILLCDSRFHNPRQKNQLSSWIQGHLKATNLNNLSFGPAIAEVSRFFRNAEKILPKTKLIRDVDAIAPLKSTENNKEILVIPSVKIEKLENNPEVYYAEAQQPTFKFSDYQYSNVKKEYKYKDFLSQISTPVDSVMDFNNIAPSTSSLVTIHKRERSSEMISLESSTSSALLKKRKFKFVPHEVINLADNDDDGEEKEKPIPETRKDLLAMIKKEINLDKYKKYLNTLTNYRDGGSFDNFISGLMVCFHRPGLYYLLKAMRRFTKPEHEKLFDEKIELICGKTTTSTVVTT